jgi:hypothetical protein
VCQQCERRCRVHRKDWSPEEDERVKELDEKRLEKQHQAVAESWAAWATMTVKTEGGTIEGAEEDIVALVASDIRQSVNGCCELELQANNFWPFAKWTSLR